MEFWQNIVLKWKQIQQFCLWALSSDPSGLVESGLYYNTTANRAALRDDTKTQFLAHLEDTYKNAGVVKQPTITKGAGSVTVGNDAIIRCYKTTDYSGIIQEVVNPTGGTFALTENTPLWLVYIYGVGYSVQTSITGPLSNAIPVYRFFNAFGVIHSSTQDEMGVGATEKILVKQSRTEYIKRVGDSGIELSTSALNVLISGGLAYNGPILETILPFNSATNNLYRVVYDDGVWSQTTLHSLTNTHYNPSTGLAALNSNKYCWAYVWRSIGNDVEALFQLGEQEYATEALAVADLGKMPANIYGLYATHCVLVGYVLIKQGVTTTQYFSAWGRPTVAGAPVYHNTLAGLDGGDPATAYMGHAKLIDNTRMNAAGTANGYALLGADGKLPSGQLPSYVDDVLEYAAKANFPATGESGKIYVDLTTNLTWRWSGTTYVEISPSLALGETSATAYRGDRGKVAYDHSQITGANPHGTTASQIASTATGDVGATNVQSAIAELASKKLSASVAATTYAPISTMYVNRLPGDSAKNVKICDWSISKTAYEGGVFVVRIFEYDTWFSGGYIDVMFRFNILATASSFAWSFEFVGGSDALRNYVTIRYTEDSIAFYFAIACFSTNPRILSQLLVVEPSTMQITMGYRNILDPGSSIFPALQNSATADKLATARDIALSGGVSGSGSFDGSGNLSIAATVTDDSHNHVIENVDDLQGVLDSKAPTSHASTDATYGVADATHFGHAMASSAAPAMNGETSAGTDNGKYACEGHVHPSDTAKFGYSGGFSANPSIWKGTHAQYNALGIWDSNTIYVSYT